MYKVDCYTFIIVVLLPKIFSIQTNTFDALIFILI
jgi:hypothetical protein